MLKLQVGDILVPFGEDKEDAGNWHIVVECGDIVKVLYGKCIHIINPDQFERGRMSKDQMWLAACLNA